MNAVAEIGTDAGILAHREPRRDMTLVEMNAGARRANDPFVELLETIAEARDVRAAFPRVSESASRVLPHEALELTVHDHDDRVALHVRSTHTLPASLPTTIGAHEDGLIVGDLREAAMRGAGLQPGAGLESLAAAGYRSFVSVRSAAPGLAIRLRFFSKRPAAYTHHDVPAARRIAAALAVAVSHGQLALAERVRSEARTHAEHGDSRGRSLVQHAPGISATERAVGESAAWRTVLTHATKVAGTDTTVLLQGESGTGKEVVARFIHRASPRRNGPFVAINCAALPEQLLESELFGYERGAFTSAHQSKVGQIELATGGVLFLDEVGEMSATAQAKLLRFLQEREFQRLGGTRLVRANVRVVAATNRDLRQAVKEGRFREDLYYRLQVFDIQLPPLRDRPEDIPPLADAFLRELGRSLGRTPELTHQALERLLTHTWPGNVRELHNALERAAVLATHGLIGVEHLSLWAAPTPAAPSTDLGLVERHTIERVLRDTSGNKSKAARRLGITRTQLYVRLRKYGLESGSAA